MLSMIIAAAQNRVMGKDNQMPWHLPNDLQYFKKVTMGKPMIMGRKTYESLGNLAWSSPYYYYSPAKLCAAQCQRTGAGSEHY